MNVMTYIQDQKDVFQSVWKDQLSQHRLPALVLFSCVAIYVLYVVSCVVRRVSQFIKDRWHGYVGLQSIPGPRGIPFFGVIPATLWNLFRFYEWREDLVRKYGPTLKTPADLFHNGTLITNDPKNIEHILSTNFNNYIKPPIMCDAFDEFLGDSIFTANHAHTHQNGEIWKFQRKVLARVFSTNAFRHFSKHVFAVHSKQVVSQLHDMAVKCAKNASATFDLEQLCVQFTAKATYSIGFGLDLPHEHDHGNFHEIFRRVNELCTHRFVKPWYKMFKWCMPSEYELKRNLKVMDEIIYGIIKERAQADPEHLAQQHDMLSYFLLKNHEMEYSIPHKLLRDIIMAIYSAGRDTTACGMVWVLYTVSKHPEVEEKLVKEIENVLGKCTDNEAEMTYDMLQQLPYLEAVINETWRLYPPLPIEMKYAHQDDVLPDGTFVPAKVRVEFSARTMGRMESLWKDAMVFRPERWLEMKTKPSAFMNPIFQAGPRICLGQKLAYLETKMLLCSMYHQYTFKCTDPVDQEPAYDLSTALFKRGGLMMSVHKRYA